MILSSLFFVIHLDVQWVELQNPTQATKIRFMKGKVSECFLPYQLQVWFKAR